MASGAQIDASSIEQVMAVTAADHQRAVSLLATANGHVERAINLHFEAASDQLAPSTSAAAAGTPASIADDSEERPVRAPILPRADVLAEPGHSAANYTAVAATRRRPRWTRHSDSVFDKFRDFSAEIRLQEERAGLRAPVPTPLTAEPSTAPAAGSKRRTLEEMFRPPLELLSRGSLQTVRDRGVSLRRWLLVNVQNTEEFACQVLNRDVWSQPAVVRLVRERFVFWQVYHESGEGLKYRTFYPVSEWPYVGVLDPRTGELLRVWKNMDRDNALRLLSDFLAAHRYGNESPPPEKRPRQQQGLVDLDEEAQMRLAIERSLRAKTSGVNGQQKTAVHGYSSSSEVEQDDGDDEEAIDPVGSVPASPKLVQNGDKSPERHCDSPSSVLVEQGLSAAASADPPTTTASRAEDWRRYMGASADPLWTLALRLPDGRREQLQLPSSSLMRCVCLYAEQLGFSTACHELVSTFPRRRLSQPELLNQTLHQLGLHSHDTLFVQRR